MCIGGYGAVARLEEEFYSEEVSYLTCAVFFLASIFPTGAMASDETSGGRWLRRSQMVRRRTKEGVYGRKDR